MRAKLALIAFSMLLVLASPAAFPSQASVVSPSQASFPKEAYVFELLHTRVRFEADGKGSRELTARVRVQSESAIHEFGLLRLSYASSFESLDVDYIRVRKPDGTVVSTPASDVQDLDSEVSRAAPMYTDQREKHVAVKALAVGDILEYHFVWTVHDPIAADHFWLDDTFFRAGICLDEQIEFDVPRSLPVKFASGSVVPVVTETAAHRVYTLHSSNLTRPDDDDIPAWEKGAGTAAPPDIQVSSFQSWEEVGKWYGELAAPQAKVTPQIQAKAEEVTRGKATDAEKIRALYEFVSLRFRYIGVSLGQGRYSPHRAEEVLANRYGDCKDKHTLFAALLAAVGIKAYPALISSTSKIDSAVPSPSLFDHIITAVPQGDSFLFLDTTPEVAVFGYLLTPLRDKAALVATAGTPPRLVKTPPNPPGANTENFRMDASLDLQGTLDGKARVETRGDSEIQLRSAFRATAESQWKDLVQSVSGAMGFGGTVSEVSAAQPEVTGEPFWFSYSYHRPDYSDWKERQITLPLPPVMLPALSGKRKSSKDSLALGSPVEITYEAKVTLPNGMKPILPPTIELRRNFATYYASYSFENGVLTGIRHLKTQMSEIPGSERAAYAEFVDSLVEDQNHFMPLVGNSGGNLGATIGGIGPMGAPAHSDNEEAQHLYDEARESLQLGAPRAAVSALERALKLDPKWSDAWVLLGSAHMMASQFDPALEAFRKAVLLDPSNTKGYRAVALALMSKHRDAEAIKEWRDLLKMNPDDSQASANLRMLLLRAGNYADALPLLEKATEANSEVPGNHLQLGQVLLHLGDEEKSMAHFQKALQLDPNPEMLNSVAYSLAEANRRLNDALHYAEEAVEKTEEQTASARWEFMNAANLGIMGDLAAQWDTLGWVKFRLGDFAGALKYLESAWSLMQDATIADHLGQVYEKLGKKQQAARAYAMALSALGPNGNSKFRDRMSSKIASLSDAGTTVTKDASSELSSSRTYRVPNFTDWGGGYKSAEFGIAFTKGPAVQSVWYRSGAEELRNGADDVSDLKFKVLFPDDGPTRIVRLAILSCSEVSKGCTLAFLPVQQPRPSWANNLPSTSIQ
jgi:tetratricopeptide (TPR) repeat protein/transglutaminase-like putative cysteine protease